jgi:thiamine-phosphate pyrophosphorylase
MRDADGVPSAASHEPREWGLFLVTDRKQTAGRELVDVLAQALVGGVRAIQLREKDLATVEIYRLGERLLPMTHEAGAALIVNDRVDVAMALGADGVHLTRKSLPPHEVRALVGPGMLVGVSCHGMADVHEAVAGGADYLALGPIYATPSKETYGPPLGPDMLRQARAVCPISILAIGGITAQRVPEVTAAGADGVAVISAVLASPDPGRASRELIGAVARTKGVE